ncbi:MAG: hypothetical protein LBM87_04880 [Ruminococcus sp.]|jgi:hypothetical protein|nr:hypothetical protein [Ruminococcus sp.]
MDQNNLKLIIARILEEGSAKLDLTPGSERLNRGFLLSETDETVKKAYEIEGQLIVMAKPGTQTASRLQRHYGSNFNVRWATYFTTVRAISRVLAMEKISDLETFNAAIEKQNAA